MRPLPPDRDGSMLGSELALGLGCGLTVGLTSALGLDRARWPPVWLWGSAPAGTGWPSCGVDCGWPDPSEPPHRMAPCPQA